jgi:ribosomal protein S7
MAVRLAEELLRRVQGNREQPDEWFFAASILSSAFNATGKYAEAEAVCREAMTSVDWMGISAATPSMTQLREHLGNALSNQGKVAKAQPIFERCLAELKQRLGHHHEKTLDTAISLGGNLACQGKHAEAVVILKDTLDRASERTALSTLQHFVAVRSWPMSSTVCVNTTRPGQFITSFYR